MTLEIRIYVEGGGDGAATKGAVRQGFGAFLKPLRDSARRSRIGWRIIACGSRNSAFEDFSTALRTHPDAFNVLLVDSEDPVTAPPWTHLRQRDRWETPDLPDAHCHLMVQTMEAWLLADRDALVRFYGLQFSAGRLPGHSDVEQVDKRALLGALKAATRNTGKGEYHKIRHGPKLLANLDPSKVRDAARNCDRLFSTLTDLMRD